MLEWYSTPNFLVGRLYFVAVICIGRIEEWPSRSFTRAIMGDEEVQYVKLISAEGHEFLMDRSIAIAYSSTVRMMLEGSFLEARENVIRFPDMAGYILERLVKYLHYKAKYSNSTTRIPDFVSYACNLAGRRCVSSLAPFSSRNNANNSSFV